MVFRYHFEHPRRCNFNSLIDDDAAGGVERSEYIFCTVVILLGFADANFDTTKCVTLECIKN